MHPALSALISLIGVLLSGAIGGLTVWLAVRKRLEEETLAKATRRTTALQLLSDEEFTIEQVRDECVAMDTLVSLRKARTHQDHLASEVQRILAEATEMLSEVRERRKSVETTLLSLQATDLEAVIARAYHGKRRAESQLRRTQLSRTEVLKAFEAASEANPSLKRSANGRPPGPVWRYAVHFRQPGPGVLPSSPA